MDSGRGVADPVAAPTRPMGLPLAALTSPPTEPPAEPPAEPQTEPGVGSPNGSPSRPGTAVRSVTPLSSPVTGPWPLPGVGLPGPAATTGGSPRPPRRSGGRGRRLAVLAVAALIGVGGTVLARGEVPRIDAWRGALGATAGEDATPPGRREAVAALIGRLDAAVSGQDQAALAALVAPGADPVRRRWQGLPARAAAVGATGLRLSLPPGPLPEPGAGRSEAAGAGRVPAGVEEALTVPVRLGYALPGWDGAPVTTVISVRVGRSGHTWRLIDDAGVPPLDAATPIEPWVGQAVSVVRTSQVMVVGDPSRRADNERLAQALEQAVGSVRAAVPPRRWNGRVVAYAATDERVVASWFGTQAAGEGGRAGTDPAAFAAEVRTLSGQPAGGSSAASPGPVAARMALTPFLLGRTDARAQAVLRHEVTHVALALEGPGAVPTWIVEGTAEYVAYRSVASGRVRGLTALDRRGLPSASWQQLRSTGWRPLLVTDGQRFYTGTNAQVARAYTDAWLTCLYIAAHYGEARLFELYRAAAAAPSGQDATAIEATVLRRVLKVDRARLQREASGYARGLRNKFT